MRYFLHVGGLLLVLALAAGGTWLALRKGDGPKGEEPKPGETSTAPQARGEIPGLRVAAEKDVQFTRAAGGTIELDDGTRLVIPPNALPRDSRVTLRRLTNPGPEGRTMTITDVDVGGATLEADAVLTLPYPEVRKPGYQFQVRHFHDGQMTELPGRHDPARGVVEVRTRQFSQLLVAAVVVAYLTGTFESGQAWASFHADIQNNPVDPPLVVPFYHQDKAEWCWAASAQMILKAYGKDKGCEIWDLARHLGKDVKSGIKLSDVVTGRLDEFFRDKAGLPTEGTKTGWANISELGLYITAQLRARQPVWINLFGENHALVAVGFNNKEIFLHDPANSSDNAIPVSWEKFCNEFCAGTLNPAKAFGCISTLTVQQPLVAPEPVTVAVQPKRLKFTHSGPAWSKVNPSIEFVWDGTADLGYLFDAGIPANQANPPYATRSDRILLSVFLANASQYSGPRKLDRRLSYTGSPGKGNRWRASGRVTRRRSRPRSHWRRSRATRPSTSWRRTTGSTRP